MEATGEGDILRHRVSFLLSIAVHLETDHFHFSAKIEFFATNQMISLLAELMLCAPWWKCCLGVHFKRDILDSYLSVLAPTVFLVSEYLLF